MAPTGSTSEGNSNSVEVQQPLVPLDAVAINVHASKLQYGIPLKLRHWVTGMILHSHSDTYKHLHSSQQQEVTCFGGRDDNDYFIVFSGLGSPIPGTKYVKDGAIIRLKHKSTGNFLHSHRNIPSPCTRQQEVTCYGCGDDNDNWRLEVSEGDRFRLIHCNTNHALHSHGGFYFGHHHQQEVTCFGGRDDNDFWTVESFESK